MFTRIILISWLPLLFCACASPEPAVPENSGNETLGHEPLSLTVRREPTTKLSDENQEAFSKTLIAYEDRLIVDTTRVVAAQFLPHATDPKQHVLHVYLESRSGVEIIKIEIVGTQASYIFNKWKETREHVVQPKP